MESVELDQGILGVKEFLIRMLKRSSLRVGLEIYLSFERSEAGLTQKTEKMMKF